MTDKQFIKFCKKYFGDLDYTKLTEQQYIELFEEKEADRINSMAEKGKLSKLFSKLSLNVQGNFITLTYNGEIISSTQISNSIIPL